MGSWKHTSQKPVMKILTLICFLFNALVETEGADSREFDANLNKLLSPVFVCFKERKGATCPPESTCSPCRNCTDECKNTTQCCVSTYDPLTRLYLFTVKNKEQPEFVHKCGGRLASNTFFDPNVDTIVLIHGLFDGPCRTAAWREIKDQLFHRGNYNVLMVDWSRENLPDIYDALYANKFVGRRTACVIQNIMIQQGVTGDKFYLVGHSMGSHISGYAGQFINKCNNIKLRRITALDPSNFGYYGYPPDERLSPDDAQCVDAIHVNIGDCFPLHIGYKANIGHADFYPNGGSVQLSCYPFMLQSFLKLDIFTGLISFIPSFCFHLQALQFYKISINPLECLFVGVQCNSYEEFKSGACKTCGRNDSSCAVMGFDFEKFNGPCSGSHQYFLETGLLCPFCNESPIKLNGFLGN